MSNDKALMLQEYIYLMFGDNEDYSLELLDEVTDITLLWCSGLSRMTVEGWETKKRSSKNYDMGVRFAAQMMASLTSELTISNNDPIYDREVVQAYVGIYLKSLGFRYTETAGDIINFVLEYCAEMCENGFIHDSEVVDTEEFIQGSNDTFTYLAARYRSYITA